MVEVLGVGFQIRDSSQQGPVCFASQMLHGTGKQTLAHFSGLIVSLSQYRQEQGDIFYVRMAQSRFWVDLLMD